MKLANFRTDRNENPYGLKKCKYHCDYGDGEYCHYKEKDECIYNKTKEEIDGQIKGRRRCIMIDDWANLCPICEYPFERCQCRFGGSAHPDRSDRARVVFDHLYLLTAGQLDHVMNVQSFWQTSYADEKRNTILLYLIRRAKENCGLDKPLMVKQHFEAQESL